MHAGTLVGLAVWERIIGDADAKTFATYLRGNAYNSYSSTMSQQAVKQSIMRDLQGMNNSLIGLYIAQDKLLGTTRHGTLMMNPVNDNAKLGSFYGEIVAHDNKTINASPEAEP
jgi:hypothetical protein